MRLTIFSNPMRPMCCAKYTLSSPHLTLSTPRNLGLDREHDFASPFSFWLTTIRTRGLLSGYFLICGSNKVYQSIGKCTPPAQVIVPANKLSVVNVISFTQQHLPHARIF